LAIINVPRGLIRVITDRLRKQPAAQQPSSKIPTRSLESSSILTSPHAAEPIAPVVNIRGLLQMSYDNILTNTIFTGIIKQFIKKPPLIVPRFTGKCPLDGVEVNDTNIRTCPVDGSTLTAPDPQQRETLAHFLEQPNPDDEWRAILESSLWHHLAVDDWWWEVASAEAEMPNGERVTRIGALYPLHPAYMKIINPRVYEYYCEQHQEQVRVFITEPEEVPVCEEDGQPMVRAFYIYQPQQDNIVRFTKPQIIHGKSGKNLPSMFGQPSMFAVWHEVLITHFMTKTNLDIYSTGKTDKMIFFPNLTAEQVSEMVLNLEKASYAWKTDPSTGHTTRKLRVAMFGSQGQVGTPNESPTVVDTMPAFQKMQSLDWYTEMRRVIAANWGVTESVVNISEPGRLGNVQDWGVDVTNDSVEAYQALFDEVINNQLLPKLGVHDWLYKSQLPAEEDQIKRTQLLLLEMQTSNLALQAGFTVTKPGPDKPLEISGQAKLQPKPEAAPQMGLPGEPPPPRLEAPSTPPLPVEKARLRRGETVKRAHKRYVIQEYEEPEPTEANIIRKSEKQEIRKLQKDVLEKKGKLIEKMMRDIPDREPVQG